MGFCAWTSFLCNPNAKIYWIFQNFYYLKRWTFCCTYRIGFRENKLVVDTLALLQRDLSTPFECTYLRCCVWVIRDNQREGHFRHSWLPYSTYLYLDFYLFCSMTKLKEYSREMLVERAIFIIQSVLWKKQRKTSVPDVFSKFWSPENF